MKRIAKSSGTRRMAPLCRSRFHLCELYPSDDATVALKKLREFIPIAKLVGRPKGKVSIRNISPYGGTRAVYTLARLKRDAPELAAKVERGELSANSAAIQAGFRARLVQHPATVNGFTRAIRKHLPANAQRELIRRLSK
jgi:hypothetical protein